MQHRSKRNAHYRRNRGVPPSGRPVGELRPLLENMVTRVFNVDMDLVRLSTRGRAPVALARQVAMYLAHDACGVSLTEAGELFKRDRTTAAHACQVVEARRADPAFDRAITLLECVVAALNGPRVMTQGATGQLLGVRGLRA
jgi:hypothetical protein